MARDGKDTQDTNQTLVETSSMRAVTHMQTTLVMQSARRGMQQMPPGRLAQPINVDIIDVLDDEKENIPVKTRRVRRHVSVTSNVSIIDLSGN